MENYDTAKEAYLAREQHLRETSRYMETIRERYRQLEHAFNQAHAFDLLERPDEFVEAELEDELLEQGMTDEQFQSACAAMNMKQRELFMFVTRSIHKQMQGDAAFDCL